MHLRNTEQLYSSHHASGHERASITSGYFVGDTYVNWKNVGSCIRPGYTGPWTCYPRTFSWLESINVPLVPYACTHNP